MHLIFFPKGLLTCTFRPWLCCNLPHSSQSPVGRSSTPTFHFRPAYQMPRGPHLPVHHLLKTAFSARSSLKFPHSSSRLLQPAIKQKSYSVTPFRRGEWPYLYSDRTSPTMAPQLDSYFKQVDTLAESFIDRLRQAVAIPSVSAADEHRPDVVKVFRPAVHQGRVTLDY